jgi:hypothetical protein
MSSNTSKAGPPLSSLVKVVPWRWEFGVGAVLPLTDEPCVSFDDWEENDNVEAGGD